MNNIYLVGFMGTGKTVVGRELARSLGIQFADLDELIEIREKRSIADIFAKEGEQYFRCLESGMLKELARESLLFVVACGGGIVLRPENIAIMKESGRIVCLSAAAQVILERTKGDMSRPLLNVANPLERIQSLLKAREPFYALAEITVDTTRLNVIQVVESIRKGLDDHTAGGTGQA